MSEEKKDHISDALGIHPMLPEDQSSKQVEDIISKGYDDSAKTDFEMARQNIYEVIQNGQNAMDRLSQIADSSQHPRAFEVLAKLMDTMLSANKDLLELQKQIREIDSADSPMNSSAQNITNNLFVGSTSELQKMIEKMKNGGPE